MIILNECNQRTNLHSKRVIEGRDALKAARQGLWERTLGMRPGRWEMPLKSPGKS